MYTQFPCSEPNASSPWTPVSLAAIAQANAKMDRGNKALSDLVTALTPDFPTTTSLALLRQTTGQLGTNFKGFGKRGVAPGIPARNGRMAYPRGNLAAEVRRLIPACPCANPKSCDCGPPLAAEKPVVKMVVKPAIKLADPLGPQLPKNCRTNNICRDLQTGCVQQPQVTPAQSFACAKAGWSGNYGFYAFVPNAPFLGDVDLNPASPGPEDDMGSLRKQAGLSGFVADLSQSSIFWGGLALAGFTYWYMKGRR